MGKSQLFWGHGTFSDSVIPSACDTEVKKEEWETEEAQVVVYGLQGDMITSLHWLLPEGRQITIKTVR